MTLDDLKHIFRFQLVADDEFTPTDTVTYTLFEGQDRVTGTADIEKLDTLIPLLDNFQFDGYSNRTPLFIKPDSQL